MLPEDIYTTAQVRELDRMAIEDHGIPGYELMQRAGLVTFNSLLLSWPNTRSIQIYCGAGNNGGDGYVIARLAVQNGIQVEIITLGDHTNISGDALKAKQDWETAGSSQPIDSRPDVIVDAIFGTGLSRPPQNEYLQAIEAINISSTVVISVDVPSGLNSDSGMPLDIAVIADKTVSYIGMKQGLLTGKAKDFTGILEFDSLDIPLAVYAKSHTETIPTAKHLKHELLESLLPPRKPSTHKGDCGHALIIGGANGMQGAAQMTAEACARSGAGLITLATETANQARPEIMSCLSSNTASLQAAIERSTVIAIGPGLGTSNLAQQLLKAACASNHPLVLDADALNVLANTPQFSNHWILTPHPGEAARLLNTTTQKIQSDRFTAIRALQQKYGGVCILKGFGTLIYDGNSLSICSAGNPGMASGGMGDVLTGVISGLVAQQLSLYDAARAGVYIHAHAADLAAQNEGERGLLATDLFPYIRSLVNPKVKT